jgi:hypothetical protein
MQEVVTILETIIFSEQSDVINYNFNEKKELEHKSNSNSGIGTTEINNGLINDATSLNIESGIIMKSENGSTSASNQAMELSVNDINDVYDDSINIMSSYIESKIMMESENSSPSASNQAVIPSDNKCYENQLLLEHEKEGLTSTPDDKVENF